MGEFKILEVKTIENSKLLESKLLNLYCIDYFKLFFFSQLLSFTSSKTISHYSRLLIKLFLHNSKCHELQNINSLGTQRFITGPSSLELQIITKSFDFEEKTKFYFSSQCIYFNTLKLEWVVFAH